MKKILLKILEGIALAGMVVFLGFLFLIELIDLFFIRPSLGCLQRRNVGEEYEDSNYYRSTLWVS